jgi:hypothetical protein
MYPFRWAAVTAGVITSAMSLLTSVLPPTHPAQLTPTPAQRGQAQAPGFSAEPKHYGLAYGDTLVWMSEAQLSTALDDAVTLGTTLIRIDISWADVQYDRPTSYNWARLDRVVNAAVARHLSVDAVLAYTPPWARLSGCTVQACAPADAAKFADFAGVAVRRYAALGVHTWEIWNEENISSFWAPRPDAAAYGRLIKATVPVIRQADSNAFVVMGGLAATKTSPFAISELAFLSAVSTLRVNQQVDAIAYHPYTYPYLASFQGFSWDTPWDRIDRSKNSLAQILSKYGTPNKPIWLTEFGAPTGGRGTASDGTVSAITPATDHVTEQRQAQIATDAVKVVRADPHISTLIWYGQQDQAKQSQSNEGFYGLRRADGTPKPAFSAVRAAIRTQP